MLFRLAAFVAAFIVLTADNHAADPPKGDAGKKVEYFEIWVDGKFKSRVYDGRATADRLAVDYVKVKKGKASEVRGPFLGVKPDDKTGDDKTPPEPDPNLTVAEGQITFDAEGGQNPPSSPWFTRRIHWPGGASGVTIGIGYDMGYRSAETIKQQLMQAGLSEKDAEFLSGAAGLTGPQASAWKTKNKKAAPTITTAQQKALFELIYPMYKDTGGPNIGSAKGVVEKRFAANAKKKLPAVSWDSLSAEMKTILTDMQYRGDLNRDSIQPQIEDAVRSNDMTKLLAAMSDDKFWGFTGPKDTQGRLSLPRDRYVRRINYIKGVLGQK